MRPTGLARRASPLVESVILRSAVRTASRDARRHPKADLPSSISWAGEKCGIGVVVLVLGGLLIAPAHGAPETLFSREPLTLKPEVIGTVPQIEVSSRTNRIYGVSFEYRATKEAVLSPRHCRLFKGKTITTYQSFIPDYGLLKFYAEPMWQEGKCEFLMKKGTTGVGLSFRLPSGDSAQVRNIRLVPGGFPKTPPVPGAPYVTWIKSLHAEPDLAKAAPLVTFAREGCNMWWGGGRRIKFWSSEQQQIKSEPIPYLKVSPERLIELMPERRPLGTFVTNAQRRDGKVKRPLWNPLEPDVCYNPDGSVCDYKREYPLTGYEDVVAPSGRILKVPYHHPKGAPVKRVWKQANQRVYWDKFMTTARVSEMTRNAYFLAILHRTKGDEAAGIRAAAMLWALARRIPDYAMYGSSTSRWPWNKFWPPDNYEQSRTFIIGIWHSPATRFFAAPARTFDLLRDSPDIWSELDRITQRDSRQDVADGLLFAARMSLMKDASRRVSPLHYYHNVANSQSITMIEIGMAIGCPELVHYGVRKTLAILRATFMADGMFPESTSYMQQVLGQYSHVFGLMEGYSDPPGFTSRLDGVRFDDFKAAEDGALYSHAPALHNRLRFPDGAPLTVHDTWSHTTHFRPKRPPESWSPLVIPDFGHVGLGWGKLDEAVAPHLHFSGFYNHGHLDMLNLMLWAYGDELATDIGYTHVGLYARGAIAHNIVVIDSKPQKRGHAGSMLSLHAHADAAQVVQAEGAHAYDVASRYRRGIVLVPFGSGRDVVVDIFEVTGGGRHEWLANGCADYEQDLATTLKPTKTLDNLAPDGKVVTSIQRSEPVAEAGKPSPFWGLFRQGRVAQPFEPWTVTLTAQEPVPPKTPGAGPRAVAKNPKPGLRLHWLAPTDATAVLARAPRCRYSSELANKSNAWAAFSKNMMHKVIVRRDGKDLNSTFLAVWEPFPRKPWLDVVERLDAVPEADGVGVRLKDGSQSAVVLYRRPESKSRLSAAGLDSDARYTVLRTGVGEQSLDVYDGTSAKAGPVAVQLQPGQSCPVSTVTESQGVHAITVKGDLSTYPTDPKAQPHAGGLILWRQEGQVNRWLPLARVESVLAGQWRLVLIRAPGFTYDGAKHALDETHFPMRRGLRGAAHIELPQWGNVRWRVMNGRFTSLRVRASGPITLRVDGLAAETLTVRGDRAEPLDLPVKTDGDAAIIHLNPTDLGKGWWPVDLGG